MSADKDWLNKLFATPEIQQRAAETEAQDREKLRVDSARWAKTYAKNHPERIQARSAAQYAIKTGVIVLTGCAVNDEFCKGRLEAHHHKGYDREHWLDVIGLCHYHHEIADAQELEGE